MEWSKLKMESKQESKKGYLTVPYPLTNLEIQNYFQNEPKFKIFILGYFTKYLKGCGVCCTMSIN